MDEPAPKSEKDNLPPGFAQFHVKVIHHMAVERAKQVLREALEQLSGSDIVGDGAEQTWAQQSIQAKLSALGEAYDD
jgi:hypothetical protein